MPWEQLLLSSISTHTLTWSVTLSFNVCISFLRYFNSHAHVERDDWNSLIIYLLLHFNSHAHVERDKIWIFNLIVSDISTHTLTWSVTLTLWVNKPLQTFQLTRSRGAWPTTETIEQDTGDFNSHAHVERDFPSLKWTLHSSISTHTLTWSVTDFLFYD